MAEYQDIGVELSGYVGTIEIRARRTISST